VLIPLIHRYRKTILLATTTFVVLLVILSAGLRPRESALQPPDHAGELTLVSGADTTDIPRSALLPEADGDSLAGLAPLPVSVAEQELVLGSRETFYDAILRSGGGHADIMSLVRACKPYRNLGKVHGGDLFQVAVDEAGQILRLSFELEDGESYVALQRDLDGSYQVHELTYPVEERVCIVGGTVEASIFDTLKHCGAPVALANKMNDILGWDVDFRRDVRNGDTFRILYEEIRRDGEFLRTGEILAVEYTCQGSPHRGYRYATADGRPRYFDGRGKSLQKQLLRAPLQYSRISSGFSPRRLHPVHKRYMPHYGVDYAAPVGTPVRAAGDGKVLEAGYDKNNGRFVHIRHTNQTYETYYLHFNRFAKGISRGTHVEQGQIIGYVGATGTATGPHLDFRVKRDGRWVNPRTLELPASEPVPEQDMQSFLACAALYGYSLGAVPADGPPREVALDVPLPAPGPLDLPATTALLPMLALVTSATR
jgi:murein DD-endopeptidase MepM/ murein hydrolase activator NlpD